MNTTRNNQNIFNHQMRPFRVAFRVSSIIDLKDEPVQFLTQKYATLASDLFTSPVSLEAVLDQSSLPPHLDRIQKQQEFQKKLRKEVIIHLILGRSNVGKSSLLNALFRRNLAEVSNYPGKTRHLFFYSLSSNRIMIDSPGYGYAKGSKKDAQNWGSMMYAYLSQTSFLKQAYVLIDAEHGFKEVDYMTVKMLNDLHKPFTICFTKSDKIQDQKQLRVQAEKFLHGLITSSQVLHFTAAKEMKGIRELQQSIAYYCE